MKIIGITGKSGAGKSTLADFLGERKNIGVIHLDKVMSGIKEEKFHNQIRERDKHNDPILLTSNIRTFINSNKFTFKIFMALKKRMMKSRIERKIQEFKRDGKDAVIIEGAYLREMVDEKMFNNIIYVRRPYIQRVKALEERDNISKENLVERDLPYQRRFSSSNEKDFDYVIDNNYGMDELRAASQKIYDEVIGVKTFDERYRISNTQMPNLRNILRAVDKTRKLNKSTKERSREK